MKIEKEAGTSIGYTLKSPLFIGADDENPFHTSAQYYGGSSNDYITLQSQKTTTADSAILVSKNSQADLVLRYTGKTNHIVRINPSSADTVVTAYCQKPVRVTFSYEQGGNWSESLRQFDMFLGKERTRVMPYNYSQFERRSFTDLVPGVYTVSAVFLVDDVEHHVAADFIVEADKPMTVELKDFAPASIASPRDTNVSGKVKARYTIDGRQIVAPQRGINILRMEDGSLRKVMVK